jgi:hypothetical protein
MLLVTRLPPAPGGGAFPSASPPIRARAPPVHMIMLTRTREIPRYVWCIIQSLPGSILAKAASESATFLPPMRAPTVTMLAVLTP